MGSSGLKHREEETINTIHLLVKEEEGTPITLMPAKTWRYQHFVVIPPTLNLWTLAPCRASKGDPNIRI